jgi:hypothetical protein
MPYITDQIIKNGDGFDFIYCNSASVMVDDDENFSQGEWFDDGFAMGYGAYRTTRAVNPLTGHMHEYQECICVPINPKTIRHIVGVPNHIRVWNKKFYDSIDGHNKNLRVVDDYELIVRSFLAGGKFLHLDTLGYLQVYHGDNTTDKRRDEIQELVASILYKYDDAIRDEFERRGMDDWAYRWHAEHLGFVDTYHYWDIPTIPDADAANFKI